MVPYTVQQVRVDRRMPQIKRLKPVKLRLQGYKLPAKHVIHTVGPIWQGGNASEDKLLAACYRNSLRLAVENDIRTIAFPSISTGAYRFPLERAARIAIGEISVFLKNDSSIEKVLIVCFDKKTMKAYSTALKNLKGETCQ